MSRAILVVALLFCACKKKASEPPEPEPVKPVVEIKPPEPEKPVEPAKPVEPPVAFPIDKLKAMPDVQGTIDEVRRVAQEVAPDMGVIHINAKYVHRDGTLDRTYGELTIWFALSDAPDGVIDDPNRPTGAPVPEVKPAEKPRDICPKLTLRKGTWTVEPLGCGQGKLLNDRCSITGVWEEAVKQGAPVDAVATIDRDPGLTFWTFEIQDKLRKVDFKAYVHGCSTVRSFDGSGSGSATPKKGKPNPYATE